jgi:Baseplate J-like protein
VIYQCCEDLRRAAIGRHPTLNGIDYLEVVDTDATAPADRQRILRLQLIKPLGAVTIAPANVTISGGDRIQDIAAVVVSASTGSTDVEIRVDRWGDFSPYTLQLVELADGDQVPLTGFDGPLSQVEFTFKAECPTDADCAPGCGCTLPDLSTAADHEIDYLTKDYQGFRQLMLDRITALNPAWTEQHAADFAVSLVELLAYVADHLSYAQDSIATEAYLATARRRVSVRRHARLVDYRIDEGAAARVFVHILVQDDAGPVTLPAAPTLAQAAPVPGQAAVLPVRFLTRDPAHALPPPVIDPSDPAFAQAVAAGVAVFELAELADRTLYDAHNEIHLYTWGGEQCCLPRGATSATLTSDLTTLRVGDVIVFAEVKGPETGLPADADPTHRHPVRLTKVSLTSDPLAGYFGDAAPVGVPPPLPVTQIAWDPADALPFPLCISAETSDGLISDVSVAYGNIVMADHGLTLAAAEPLPTVPAPTLTRAPLTSPGHCAGPIDDALSYVPPRYLPRLEYGPLTWQPRVTLPATAGGTESSDLAPYDPSAPVADLFSAPSVTEPALLVTDPAADQDWTVQPDLLASGSGAADLVVEIDDEARAVLRFGDDVYGRRPAAGTAPFAHYRVGNGLAGNIAADTISQVVTSVSGIASATNPVAGWGGREPQTLDEVRQQAPVAFRTQERAVTAEDYAVAAQQHPDVQRAVATIEWTGSWRTVFVTIDRSGGRLVDGTFTSQLRAFLENFRLAGHDVEVEAPTFVPLEIEMFVCVAPDRFQEDVQAALLDVFNSGVRTDGQPGLFNPNQLTFGQPVLLSPLYAAAQAVPGVLYVEITMFRRYGQPSTSALGTGELQLGRTEIAQLDNDPNFPDRGVLRITLGGGK